MPNEMPNPTQAELSSEFGDPYQGAREDLSIWKRRALEAETRVIEQDQIISRLVDALNSENGPTHMGEPVVVAPTAWIKADVATTLRKDECCYAFGEQNPKGSLIPLFAAPPAKVEMVPTLWEICVRDEPGNPESPCEYVYVSTTAERDSLLRCGGASVFAEYACLDKVKELNPQR